MTARIVRGMLSVWLAVSVCFFALRVLPGDAISAVLLGSGASAQTLQERRAALGLNQPVLIQYGVFIGGVLRGDLGVSLLNGRPVSTIIAENAPATISLGLGALAVAVGVGGAVGTAAGSKRFAPPAELLLGLATSIPVYWTGTLAMYLFADRLNWLPSGGAGSFAQLMMPASILGLQAGGAIGAVLAAGLRQTRDADYLRTAHAKGLSGAAVWRRHHLPNAIAPTISMIALQTGFLMGGAVITETLFSRPGLGRTLLNAVIQQDYPVVQGIVVWSAATYALINAGADALNGIIDPRIRHAVS
ncbi:MAG: ABC transporter permease [bacterium]|nr:ABC transporter permease [bacterium]